MVDKQLPPAPGPPQEDPAKAWQALRAELLGFYFNPNDKEPDTQKELAMLQEAVYAYDAMTKAQREGPDGERVIQNVNPKTNLADVAKEWNKLRDDRKRIFEVAGAFFKSAMFGNSRTPKVTYSRAKVRGQDNAKEFCWVPAGMTVSPQTVSAEVLGKRRWHTPKPNMLVKVDCGTRHPSSLSTPALVSLPQFKEVKKSALSSLQRTAGPDATEEQLNKKTMAAIDDLLKSSLSEEIIPATLDAAKKTKNWIVVDRSNATASSPSAELLLESALQFSDSKPVIVVFDSFTRYANFKPGRIVNRQLMLIVDILAKSVNGDDQPETVELDAQYDASDFSKWEPYHVRDPLQLLDPQTEDEKRFALEGEMRLPRKPEDAMIMVDEMGRQRKTADGRPLITPQLKWLYHYRQYMYNSGSHYVFYENAADSNFSMKTSGILWPEGRIFAHGGNLSYDRIQTSIAMGTPTVMLYNTGGVTQTFGSLHNYCVFGKTRIEDDCHATGNDPTRVILDKVDIVSVEPWTKKFGLTVVMKMQNLEKRAPELMRKSIAVVDILTESPEQIVEKITDCFAGGSKGLPELGLGSAAEDCVLNAWQSHMTFTKNARIFRRWGDIFHYFSLFLILLSSTCAILVTTPEMVAEWTGGTGFNWMYNFEMLLLVVPITSSVLAAIISQKRMIQKWAALKSAAAQIVREIYCFRMNVMEYDPQAASTAAGGDEGDEEEDTEEAATGGTLFNAREVFVKRYQEINKFALDQVGDDSLARHANTYLDLNYQAHKDIFKQRLRQYVPNEVLGGFQKVEGLTEMAGAVGKWFKRCLCGKPKYSAGHIPPDPNGKKPGHVKTGPTKTDPKKPQEFDDVEAGDAPPMETGSIGSIEPDDFVSPCTIETYIEYRSKKLLNLCKAAWLPLASKLSQLELLVIIAGAAGTLISAMGYPRWVALSVAYASVIMNAMQHEMLQQRLTSTKSAVRDLKNINVQMDSLSIVSKRTQEMKMMCVNTVETAMLETTTSWTGVSARPSAEAAEGGGGEK